MKVFSSSPFATADIGQGYSIGRPTEKKTWELRTSRNGQSTLSGEASVFRARTGFYRDSIHETAFPLVRSLPTLFAASRSTRTSTLRICRRARRTSPTATASAPMHRGSTRQSRFRDALAGRSTCHRMGPTDLSGVIPPCASLIAESLGLGPAECRPTGWRHAKSGPGAAAPPIRASFVCLGGITGFHLIPDKLQGCGSLSRPKRRGSIPDRLRSRLSLP